MTEDSLKNPEVAKQFRKNEEYRDGWERIFGPKPDGLEAEIPTLGGRSWMDLTPQEVVDRARTMVRSRVASPSSLQESEPAVGSWEWAKKHWPQPPEHDEHDWKALYEIAVKERALAENEIRRLNVELSCAKAREDDLKIKLKDLEGYIDGEYDRIRVAMEIAD